MKTDEGTRGSWVFAEQLRNVEKSGGSLEEKRSQHMRGAECWVLGRPSVLWFICRFGKDRRERQAKARQDRLSIERTVFADQ